MQFLKEVFHFKKSLKSCSEFKREQIAKVISERKSVSRLKIFPDIGFWKAIALHELNLTEPKAYEGSNTTAEMVNW